MKLHYIGTGGAEGFPGIFCECEACRRARKAGGRNWKTRSCSLLNDRVLIDISPDLYPQSLKFGLRLSDVRHLVMTHSHCDHLDTFSVCLRARDGATILPEIQKEENYLTIHGGSAVITAIKTALNGQPQANTSRLSFSKVTAYEPFEAEGLKFYPLTANHKPDEVCFIYAIQEQDKWLLYANDTGALSTVTLAAIKRLDAVFDVVSMDCGRGTLPGDGHMGIAENRTLRSELESLGCADKHTRYFLNHLCHMSGVTHDDLQNLMGPEGFTVAYDGLLVEI